MRYKNHLWVGNYYYDVYAKDSVNFIAGYKERRYLDEVDGAWYWQLAPNLWKVDCKTCVKKLLKTKVNMEEIAVTLASPEGRVALLKWGINFTPETWLPESYYLRI